MFADLSIVDAIESVSLVPRQDEGAGGSAPPTMLEAAEGVLGELTAGTKLIVIEPPPTPTRESTNVPLSP
jgi:hypothetical protein